MRSFQAMLVVLPFAIWVAQTPAFAKSESALSKPVPVEGAPGTFKISYDCKSTVPLKAQQDKKEPDLWRFPPVICSFTNVKNGIKRTLTKIEVHFACRGNSEPTFDACASEKVSKEVGSKINEIMDQSEKAMEAK